MIKRRFALVCTLAQVFGVILPVCVCGHTKFDGHQLFKVFLRSRRDQDALEELKKHIKVELVNNPENYPLPKPVEVLVSPGQKNLVQIFLKSRGLEYKVTIDNIESGTDGQGVERERCKQVDPIDFDPTRFDFSCFHPLNEIYSWMRYMAKEFPNVITLMEIGKSFEGRPLYVLKITGPDYGEEKGGIWLDAGIHSNEWVAPATLLYFIDQLVRGHGEDRELTWLVDSLDWYFLPVFNPDGYVYTWTKDRLWRKNRAVYPVQHKNNSHCVGVDLNRNWDAHWAESNAERDPCSRMYIGPAPFSEPETEAVARFLANHNDSIKAYLAYHSFSQLWMLPYSYSKEQNPPNLEQLTMIGTQAIRALQQVHGTPYKIGKISELVGEASGASVDYTYTNLGIEYSFGIELRDQGEYGTRLPEDQIIPNAQESLEAVKVIGFFLIDKVAGNDDYWTG